MEYIKDISNHSNLMKWIVTILLLLIIITGTSYFGLTYYQPFHIAIESFSSFIAFSILVMAINTYELSGNVPFLFLGIAYGFAGGFNIIHIIASNGMGFFQGDSTNLSMIFSIVPRYITAISILICFRLFYKSYKFVTPFTIIFSFSTISTAILILTFFLHKFPDCYIPGYGSTPFKILTEYFISVIELMNILILFKIKKRLESSTFLLLQFYLYATIICNILLTFYTTQQEISNVLAHIIKAISFYFIYRAIIKVGLKTPYKLLFNEVAQKDNSLKLKNFKLTETFHQLQKENELRKSMEEILLKNEACYRLLIENSRDSILIYNYEGIIFANESAAYLLGIDQPEKLLGRTILEFFPSSTQKTLLETLKKGIIEKYPPSYETQVISNSGNTIYVEVISAYITYHKKTSILGLIRDISSHKQIEKMKNKVEEDKTLINETIKSNQLITEFFANISHELRTPLNVMLSALQTLQLEEKNNGHEKMMEKRNKYLKIINQNCYRLLKLISNLIDISKIESGYTKPNIQNYNIVSVVEDITLSVAEYIQNKGIELIFDTNVEEKIIACDSDNIERIMLNLLSNAVKFSNSGDKIIVEVIDKKDDIEISVKDTGIGIPEDKLQLIFERFRQVDDSLAKAKEGSGIGLSLVKALVEMHEGKIDVRSTLGKGSEFIVSLPAKTNNAGEFMKDNLFYQNNTEKVRIEFSDI